MLLLKFYNMFSEYQKIQNKLATASTKICYLIEQKFHNVAHMKDPKRLILTILRCHYLRFEFNSKVFKLSHFN